MKKWSLTALVGCSVVAACAQPYSAGQVEEAGLRAADSDESIDVTTSALEAAARQYALDRLSRLGIVKRTDVSPYSTRSGGGATRHVRLRQLLDGVPVYGGEVVVHGSSTRITGMGGNAAAGLEAVDVTPTLSAEAAASKAKADYVGGAQGSFAYDREEQELVVLPREGESPRLVWAVKFFTEQQNGKDPGLWQYFVDAKSGAIVDKLNNLHTVFEASGPGGNAKVQRKWTSALDVEAAPSGGQYVMDTARLQTVDMKNSQSGSGTVVKGPLDNIGDAPINDAHGYAEVALNVLSQWMGYNSIDNKGFKIRSRVHYGRRYENAFWDGSQMTYGDGASTFYPLSGSVDVVAHEINHGFTTFNSNLAYRGQSGGMNESFSDIAGAIAEFFIDGANANFDVGEAVFRSATGALRYMCDPKADGRSIDNAAQFTSGLDVHYSSGVFNKAFCLSAKRLGSGSATGTATVDSVRRAGKAWYEANANYWTASSTFVQGCKGVLDAAVALSYPASDIEALQASFADVGVSCEPTKPPTPNAAPTVTITGPSRDSRVFGTITVNATASDSDGLVASVKFTFPNGESVMDLEAPFAASWDTSKSANGNATITAVAIDDKGAESEPTSVSVLVSNKGGGAGDPNASCAAGTFSATGLPLQIPDGDMTGVSSVITVSKPGTIRGASLNLNLNHRYAHDLIVNLVAPDGTTVSVLNRPANSGTGITLNGRQLDSLVGKSAAGEWRLIAKDTQKRDAGTIESWSLTFDGCSQ